MVIVGFVYSFFVLIFLFPHFESESTCSEYQRKIQHDYYPLRHCQRSGQPIIGLKNFDAVGDCANFARSRNGLAFNFGPKRRQRKNLFDVVKEKGNSTSKPKPGSGFIVDEPEEYYNCQVLSCPEYRNFSTIVNDTRFDYYSMYTRPPPPTNATCLPSIGMFMLFENKKNFSDAIKICASVGGNLAHILSEFRTNLISSMLTNLQNVSSIDHEAYVGLNETVYNQFQTSTLEPIKCFQFRAWAPYHPNENRRLPTCVAITSESSWKVYNCNRKLMFICELLSSGPNPFINLKRKCSVEKPNNRFKPIRDNNYNESDRDFY